MKSEGMDEEWRARGMGKGRNGEQSNEPMDEMKYWRTEKKEKGRRDGQGMECWKDGKRK